MYRNIETTELRVDLTLGYVYFLDKTHPLSSTKTGKVYYHRHVKSLELKRWLLPNEIVHHIDHDKKNNSPQNLMLLSRQEHRNLHLMENGISLKEVIACKVCGEETKNMKYCSDSCKRVASRKFSPSKEELEKLIWELPFTKVGEMFGVSDNAVKKKAKTLGCNIPPARFHSRKKNT